MSIYEFFDNNLPLSSTSTKAFGGSYYRDLSPQRSDAFDDYEIEYDLIEDASEAEIKLFFQRLQQGLPLTTSEKLNSVQSKLRDFLKEQSKHSFFDAISASDRRYGHFDIVCKVAAIELEGLDINLRFEDLKEVLNNNQSFSAKSNVGRRIKKALDLLAGLSSDQKNLFRNRTIVQAALTLVCQLVDIDCTITSSLLGKFFTKFLGELKQQIELGNKASDYDYLEFQRTVSANVKSGAKIRQTILMRKLLMMFPEIAEDLDPTAVSQVASANGIKELAKQISDSVDSLNSQYAGKHGDDLFKATNRTVKALLNVGTPVKNFEEYKTLIDNLYFLFREGSGTRLDNQALGSFDDINSLRTNLRHDIDHGTTGKVKAKRMKIGLAFKKYSGVTAPQALDPSKYILFQQNLLSAVLCDLHRISIS